MNKNENFKTTSDKLSEQSRKIKDLLKEKESLQAEQKRFESFDVKKERELDGLLRKKEKLESINVDIDVEKQLLQKLEKSTSKSNNSKEVISSHKRELDLLEKSISKLEQELEHLDSNQCPYCLQKYKDAKQKIDEIKEALSSKEENKKDVESIIEKAKKVLIKNDKLKEKIVDALTFKALEELNSFIQKKETLYESIERIQNEINPYNDCSEKILNVESIITNENSNYNILSEEYENMKNDLLFNDISEIYATQSKFESLSSKLIEKKNEINPYEEFLTNVKKYKPKKNKAKEIADLEELIIHEEFLLKLLTKKDSFIRKALMDKYLPFLNERLRYYLNYMALPHKVIFTSDLSTSISQFDQEISYSALSAGQKARVNIALSLAFRDVLQSKHNFINLFILDECLDVGLSNVGVRKTVKAIKEVAETNKLSMFVISHRDEVKSSFPNILNIEMKNGFSKVV